MIGGRWEVVNEWMGTGLDGLLGDGGLRGWVRHDKNMCIGCGVWAFLVMCLPGGFLGLLGFSPGVRGAEKLWVCLMGSTYELMIAGVERIICPSMTFSHGARVPCDLPGCTTIPYHTPICCICYLQVVDRTLVTQMLVPKRNTDFQTPGIMHPSIALPRPTFKTANALHRTKNFHRLTVADSSTGRAPPGYICQPSAMYGHRASDPHFNNFSIRSTCVMSMRRQQ